MKVIDSRVNSPSLSHVMLLLSIMLLINDLCVINKSYFLNCD